MNNFPDELIYQIMLFLTPKELNNFRKVNKRFYETIGQQFPFYLKEKGFVMPNGDPIDTGNQNIINDWTNGIITTTEDLADFQNFDKQISAVEGQDKIEITRILNGWLNSVKRNPQNPIKAQLQTYTKWLTGQGRLLGLSGKKPPAKNFWKVFNYWTKGTYIWQPVQVLPQSAYGKRQVTANTN